MPLYEYICSSCHHQFEEIMTVKERDTKKIICPKCHSSLVEKIIEIPTIITPSKTI